MESSSCEGSTSSYNFLLRVNQRCSIRLCWQTLFFHAFYSNTWRLDDSSVDGLSVLESYQIQNLVCEKRIDLGESVVGYKVGCTSQAIRSQFGITEPISGRLFAPHIQGEGLPIDRMAYANCAIEPEMVFTMGCDLFGSDFSDQELIEAIDHVSPGIELHNYRFGISLQAYKSLSALGVFMRV